MGYTHSKYRYTNQLFINGFYYVCMLTGLTRYTPISRYNLFIQVRKPKYNVTNCTGGTIDSYSYSTCGIYEDSFYFLLQLDCNVTQYRYSTPSSINAAVQSLLSGYMKQNDSSIAYLPYCTAYLFPPPVTSELLLKTNQLQSHSILSYVMANNVIISTARAEGSRVDHLPTEPLIMVPRPIVDPYIDYTDPIVMDKRRGLGYGIEPEECPRVCE